MRQLGSSHRSRPAAPPFKQFWAKHLLKKGIFPLRSVKALLSRLHCHVASHGPAGDVPALKMGTWRGCATVKRSGGHGVGSSAGAGDVRVTTGHGGERDSACRRAYGYVRSRAGCGSTLLQGSGEGNTNLSSDLLVRGAAKDELTRDASHKREFKF